MICYCLFCAKHKKESEMFSIYHFETEGVCKSKKCKKEYLREVK